ncbi:predicted protein [Plenodomus lingam JN3]|uniref:Predicted protein n=1 Tax=Leptosphaeria maculans (strain JN3 / isolate v23.1.3 / race Av1-4-5-6-7-8) TaxID=985895 RepID=E4ZSN8_LEPMJ|nr:predicted protein [Plenodomus lingam JN3]CBX94418.1 predicted protein [Plenodomus lingam JN3]
MEEISKKQATQSPEELWIKVFRHRESNPGLAGTVQ